MQLVRVSVKHEHVIHYVWKLLGVVYLEFGLTDL